jgi:hypothetical protein
MKVKLAKRKGYYRLVVDDKDINKKYDCTQKQPIVLACLSGWEGTECWSLHDMRLSHVIYPSPYLDSSNIQSYTPQNEEEESWLISALKQYEKQDDKYVWSTFNGVVAFGDKTFDPDVPSYVSRSLQGCWSFAEGMKKFNEIREFWENFSGDDLKSTQIVNPNFQPSSNYFMNLSIIAEMGELPKEETINKWHIINGLDERFKVTGQDNVSSTKKLKIK